MVDSTTITSSYICGRILGIAMIDDGRMLTFIEVFVDSQRSRRMLAIIRSTSPPRVCYTTKLT